MFDARNIIPFALAQNLPDKADVAPTIERLVRFGAKLLRPAEAPPHGGLRGLG